MRIFKMLALMLMGLHLSTNTQEEPPVAAEQTEQKPAPETEAVVAQEQPVAESSPEKDDTKNTKLISTAQAPEIKDVEIQPIDFEQETTKINTTENEPITEEIAETETLVIPSAPEPVIEDAAPIIEEASLQSPIGIDTVSLEDPQGNWLFKRIWWERAEERYEKIRLLVDTIWESRTKFFMKRNELDRNVLDPFYISSGIRLGELQIILSEKIDSLEKQREQEGELSEEERESLATDQESFETLKQLKTDIDSIANLDHAIDDALGKLMEQINNARSLETQAWKNFKEIAHILNDTKARELYYMIEGAARNIKNISTYLEQSFLTHFDTLTNETASHIKRVQERMQALKEKGVSFKSQAEQLAEQQKLEKQQEEEEAAEQEEEESRPKPKTGWVNWILSGIKNAFSFVISIIRLPYDMLFGKRQ